jgi:hypothetical protein
VLILIKNIDALVAEWGDKVIGFCFQCAACLTIKSRVILA